LEHYYKKNTRKAILKNRHAIEKVLEACHKKYRRYVMKGIELMKEEHGNIKRLLGVVRKLCINILNGAEVDYEAFYDAIDFIRNYADKHHHGKEESILFKEMIEKLDEKINRAPVQGMYAEHDLARLFVSNLEEALKRVKDGDMDSRVDIIANAIAYTDLLNRHIYKEDNAIYTFAEKKLSAESLNYVEEECEKFEKAAADEGVQQKYLKILEKLEAKAK
jgi:hemerythrin-like domain-containing protein